MSNWYIYKHIREDKDEVFYIGIGSTKFYRRAYSKDNRNDYWKNITKVSKYKIEIIFDNLSTEDANNKEIELIKFYGRKDLNEGTLVNQTNGGKGVNGYKHTAEQRKKNSDAKLGSIPWNKGKTNVYNEETKIRMKSGRKNFNNGWSGKTLSKEHCDKLSKSKMGKEAPNALSVDVDGVIYKSLKQAYEILGLSKKVFRRRCYSDKFPNYNIIKKPLVKK